MGLYKTSFERVLGIWGKEGVWGLDWVMILNFYKLFFFVVSFSWQVSVYDHNLKSIFNKSGHQLGEYFGNSLAVTDLNNDG